MDSADQEGQRFATVEEVRVAIEELSLEDLGRLRRTAAVLLQGSGYIAPEELLNETVQRAMEGASGMDGRRWPKRVPFMAFLVMTMKSIANASLESVETAVRGVTDPLDEASFGSMAMPGTDVVCETAEESAALDGKAAATFSAIESHFARDEKVLMMVMHLREGRRAHEIQAEEGMTLTEYATVRRRLRRGLAKLGLTGIAP